MKASKVLFFLLLPVLSISCSLGANVLDNGGFEIVRSERELPEGWHPAHILSTKAFVTFESSQDVVQSGNRSASIEIHPDHPQEPVSYNWTRPIQNIKPGTAYLLSAWVRTRDLNSPAFIMLQFWGEGDQPRILGGARTEKSFPVMGTTEWANVGTVFSVPDGISQVRIRAGISSPTNNGGKVWFDRIQIREIY